MPWVRFDDGYPQHPKIGPLSDRHYRLGSEAIFWCARNLTDGVIRAEHLTQVRSNARPADAAELVRRRLWHTPDEPPCTSEHCPPPGPDGWVIHDFWDYQPRKSQVLAERRSRAERQKRWREKRRVSNASTPNPVDALRDASATPPVDPAPPPARPAPKEAGAEPPSGPTGPDRPPAAARAADRGAGDRPPPAPPPADQLAQTRRLIAAARGKLHTAGDRREHGTAFAQLIEATTPPTPDPEETPDAA